MYRPLHLLLLSACFLMIGLGERPAIAAKRIIGNKLATRIIDTAARATHPDDRYRVLTVVRTAVNKMTPHQQRVVRSLLGTYEDHQRNPQKAWNAVLFDLSRLSGGHPVLKLVNSRSGRGLLINLESSQFRVVNSKKLQGDSTYRLDRALGL